MECPLCNGGHGNDKGKNTLGVYRVRRDDLNGIFYRCYRATCSFNGYIASDTNNDLSHKRQSPPVVTSGNYTGQTFNLDATAQAYCNEMFPALGEQMFKMHLTAHTDDDYPVVIPLYCDYKDNVVKRGYHLRNLRAGGRKYTEWDQGASILPKLAWYRKPAYVSPMKEKVGIVVEDAISALVCSHMTPTGAMLNTYCPPKATSELDIVILWPDPDLWDPFLENGELPVMSMLSRLESQNVVIRKLPSDPKYLTPEELVDYYNEDLKNGLANLK